MTQPRRIPAIVYLLIAFTASRAAYMLMGVSFDASSLPSSWHILDVAHLQNDLLSSLYWLHSQPPGFNLLIGAVLQVAGDQFSILLAALYWLTGFGIYYLVYRILRLSGTGYWPAFLLATLFIIFPERILYENWLFTTWLISGLITFAAYALWKYQAGGKRRYLTGFLAAVTLICLSRSMFLIVYLLVSIALLFFCFYPSKVRFIAYVSLLATALVLLLYLKNFALFGFFGPSSWTGMNLWRIASRVVSVEEKAMLVEAGDIPATALVTEFHPVADYAPELIQVPPTLASISLLSDEVKSSGDQNMNHFAYIRIAQEYGAASRFVLTHYPGRYLVRMKKALILYRQSIWNIDLYRDSLMAANIRAIDRYLPLKSGNSIVGIYHLLALCMTLYLVLKALWQLARLGRSSLQASILFMVMTIWYVTMISVSSEYGENARFRAQIDPILFTVFVIGIADFWANIVRLLPKRTPKLATG